MKWRLNGISLILQTNLEKVLRQKSVCVAFAIFTIITPVVDRFQIHFKDFQPFVCNSDCQKSFISKFFFSGRKGNSNSASLKPSHQSNKCLYTAFFADLTRRMGKSSSKIQKQTTRDTILEPRIFLFSCLF